jgi:hypothetical protein
MSKRELIERIMELNKSARREFLQCFTENELADYLRQLQAIGPLSSMVVEPEALLA